MKLISALLETTAYSAALCLAIIAFKAVFQKKLSPALHFALWFLLIARLLMPVTVESGFHLLPAEAAGPVMDTFTDATAPGQAIPAAPAADTRYSEAPVISSGETDAAAVQPKSDSHKSAFTLTWAQALVAAWVLGMAANAVRLICVSTKLNRRMAQYSAAPDARARRIYVECLSRLGVKRELPLTLLEGLSSPALTVSVRPRVILPGSVSDTLTDEQLGYTLAHELMHYKRGDHIVSLLLRLIETVYWFNPVVWLMKRELVRDMETACDSAVTAAYGKAERREYAMTLVTLFAQPQSGAYLLGMALSSTEKDAERRVRGVFRPHRSKAYARALAIVLSAVLLIGCFTTACQPTPETEVVVVKENTYDERQTDAASIADEIGFTEHIGGEWTLTDKLSLTLNAGMTVPVPFEDYKVYRGQLADFTQQEAYALAGLFVPGVEMTAYDGGKLTKAQVWTLLLDAQKSLAELEAGTYVHPDNMDSPAPAVEEQREIVAMYEEWYAKAPEANEVLPTDISGYTANGNYFYGEFPVEGSKFCGKFAVGYGDRNSHGGMFYNNSRYDLTEQHNMMPAPADRDDVYGDSTPPVLDTTVEEAVKTATALAERMGVTGLAYSFTTPARCWTDDMTTGTLNAWWVVFTRRIDGIPVLDLARSEQMADNGPGLPMERLVVTVSDEGVLAVNWMGYTKLTGIENERPAFIGFDSVTAAVQNGVKAQNAYIDADGLGADIERLDVEVTNGTLEYVRLKAPNGGQREVRFIPAWVFDVTYQRTWTDAALANNPYIEKTDSYGGILVINALDGSYIDPYWVSGTEESSPQVALPAA